MSGNHHTGPTETLVVVFFSKMVKLELEIQDSHCHSVVYVLFLSFLLGVLLILLHWN